MPKKDLYLTKPVLNVAGFLGYYPNTHNQHAIDSLDDLGGLGALVTDPISYLPRKTLENSQFITTPGGSLLHNGLPNAGFWGVVRAAAKKWERSSLPILPHLLAEDVEKTVKMVRTLEPAGNILAVELNIPFHRADQPSTWMEALPILQVELPIIVNLPLQFVGLYGERFIKKGASAISLRAPRGLAPLPRKEMDEQVDVVVAGSKVEMISGRLFGGQLFAQSADVIQQACKAGLPIIAGVVFDTREKVDWALALGALAVAVDLVCWR
jgi:hypothetical protein